MTSVNKTCWSFYILRDNLENVSIQDHGPLRTTASGPEEADRPRGEGEGLLSHARLVMEPEVGKKHKMLFRNLHAKKGSV